MATEDLKKRLWQIVRPLQISQEIKELYLLNQGPATGIKDPEQFIADISDETKQEDKIFAKEWRAKQALDVLGHYLLISYKTPETPQWIADYYQYLKAGIYDSKFPMVYEKLKELETSMLWQIGLLIGNDQSKQEILKAFTIMLLYFEYIQDSEYLGRIMNCYLQKNNCHEQ